MEKFGNEVVMAISEYYENDHNGKELVKDIFSYLLETTSCSNLEDKIQQWFIEENLCLDCGTRLQRYEWDEFRDDHFYETMSENICPNCSR